MVYGAGPEIPDVRYMLCGITLRGNVVSDIAAFVDHIFDSSLVRGSRNDWVFADERPSKHCTKAISATQSDDRTTLTLVDMQFPPSQGPISHHSFCDQRFR
jgi:hypothetical protein